MFERIRGALLKQQIGAIVIALLLAEAVITVVQALTAPVQFALVNAYNRAGRDIVYQEPPRMYLWQYLPAILRIILELAAAFLLYRWLFGRTQARPGEQSEIPPEV